VIKYQLVAAMGLSLSFAAANVYAQAQGSDQPGALEEIVVTAQKREQNLQDVPITLSAFDSDVVEQSGARDFAGLTTMTTGFSYSGGSPAFASPYIRGIGTNVTSVGSDPSVGVYVDGVYASRKGGSLSDLLDIERVEILKGPQGTLFGRNSIGGAISIVTAEPVNEFEGMVGLEAGNYNDWGLKGMVNVPLIADTLLLRASGLVRERDGWHENVMDGKKGGERDRTAAQLKLAWLAAEGVEIELSNFWNHSDEITPYTDNILSGLGLPVSALTKNWEDKQAVNGGLNPFGLSASDQEPTVPYFDRTMRAHALNIDWDISDALLFTSLTAYRTYETSAATDYDGTEYLIGANVNSTENNETTSQEFRLAGNSSALDWFVGVSASKEIADMQFLIGLFDFLNANGRAPFFEDSFVVAKTDSYALYGDLTWHATDNFNVTVGGRYSYDEKSIGYKNPVQTAGAAGLGGLGFIMPIPIQFTDAAGNPDPKATSLNDSWTDISPRVVLDYSIDDVMFYVSAAQGYKSGGFNTYPSVVQVPSSPNFLKVLPTATASVDPETTINLEVGVKSVWLERRLTLNAAVFSMDYDDLQVQVIKNQTVQLENAGKASSTGVELETKFLVTPDLALIVNAAWTDAEYDKFTSGSVDYAGTPLRFSPEWAGNVAVDYTMQLSDLGSLRAFVNYAYKGDHLLSEAFEQESYSTLSGRLSFASASGAWELAVFGDNLTDESFLYNYVEQVNGFGFTSANRSDPRTYGAEFTYHF
jgi:iron complex outermembrane recepter protein